MASVVLLLFPSQPLLGVLGLALSGLAQAPIFATLFSHMPKLVGQIHAPNAIDYVVGAAGVGLAILPWLASVLAKRFSLEAIPPFVLGMAIVLCLLFELRVRADRSSEAQSKVVY